MQIHDTTTQIEDEFIIRSMDTICVNESTLELPWWHNLIYTLTGMVFGVILIKSEVLSWYRIQEMFRFQSFHMFGVIGSAIVVGLISVWLLKKLGIKTFYGEEIKIHQKPFNKGQIYGGLLFGFGWALTGACPGPLYALIGSGVGIVLVMLLSAIAGTWVYGLIREKLPH